jgi:hypothetical protein
MVGGRRALLGYGAGARAWVAAGLGALGALAFAGSSCGPAFTTGTPGESDGGSTVDGGPSLDAGATSDDAGATSDADAAPGFCASLDGAPHTLCEDFVAQPFPDQFNRVGTNNGMVEPDMAILRSPPESALTVTPSQSAGAVGSALISHDFTALQSIGQHFILNDWVRFDSSSDCLSSPSPGVAIAAIVFPYSTSHYAIEVVAVATGADVIETISPDAGSTVLATHFVDLGPLALDTFLSWTVDVDLGIAKSATITVSGTQGPMQSMNGPPAGAGEDLTRPTLLLGASVTGASTGCRINTDDILFDIRASAAAM